MLGVQRFLQDVEVENFSCAPNLEQDTLLWEDRRRPRERSEKKDSRFSFPHPTTHRQTAAVAPLGFDKRPRIAPDQELNLNDAMRSKDRPEGAI